MIVALLNSSNSSEPNNSGNLVRSNPKDNNPASIKNNPSHQNFDKQLKN